MDDRQQQIQVGAGLQESRLNTDLINFLEKWGTWILTVILVVVGGYVGVAKYREWRAAELDKAFDAYASARGAPGTDGVLNGSPDNLVQVAAAHASHGSVSLLARLDAAEIYLGAARRGLRPGTDLAAIKPEDALSPKESAEMVKKAGALFQEVLASSGLTGERAVLGMRAKWGLASVAISEGNLAKAREILAEIEAAAPKAGLNEHAAEAKRRLGLMDRLSNLPPLLSDADLPAVASAAPGAGSASELIIPGPGAPGDPGIVVNDGTLQVERLPDGFQPPGMILGPPGAATTTPPADAPKPESTPKP
jgi:hypothetical protein